MLVSMGCLRPRVKEMPRRPGEGLRRPGARRMKQLQEEEKAFSGHEMEKFAALGRQQSDLKIRSGITSLVLSEDEVDFTPLLERKRSTRRAIESYGSVNEAHDSDLMLYNRL